MKKILGTLALAALVAGCSSETAPPADAGYTGFTQPAGTVAVNFVVDDTVNKNWKSAELEWKGAMLYDTTTRIVTADSTWGGPWATLYDDGPWTTKNTTTGAPGHEPAGSVAGDHKLGVTIFVKPPTTGTGDTYAYGLRDATNPDTANGGWVWIGANGSFVVPANATTAITAPGMTFPAHGTTDMKLTIDTANLLTGTTWDTSVVKVKGSAWGWSEVTLVDDGTKGDATAGDGIYTYVLSANVDQTKPPYPGLLKTNDKPEFIFVFNGKEYKDPAGIAATDGVAAGTKASTATNFTPATVAITGGTGLGSGNTYITIP
jgi:hypothetical protein